MGMKFSYPLKIGQGRQQVGTLKHPTQSQSIDAFNTFQKVANIHVHKSLILKFQLSSSFNMSVPNSQCFERLRSETLSPFVIGRYTKYIYPNKIFF